jgi:hypothetical protein
MKLLEDLKLKFPMREVAPYGFCIVVPGNDFDPDWEVELGDRGYKCFNVDIDQKRVTLVRVVKTEKGSGEKTVYSPPAAAKVAESATRMRDPENRWTEEEDEKLIQFWNAKLTAKEIGAKFPSRSEAATKNRLSRLAKKGKIKSRWHKRNKIADSEQAQASGHKSVDTPVHTPVTLDKLASGVKGILDVLDVQGRVLDKLFCALLMQAVEVKQEKGDLSIPPGLWIHYANALLEEDKQYREKFRLKVQQLLEASA